MVAVFEDMEEPMAGDGAAGDPGLDIHALQALRGRLRGPDRSALLERIEDHLDRHDGYVAVSGGKDSIVVAHLARQVDPGVPMVFFDSGLEFPETRAYLDQLRATWNANMHVITAQPSLLEVLVASGAWDHAAESQAVPSMGEIAILEPASKAHDLFGDGELWGVRAAESRGRRMMYASALTTEIATHCAGCHPHASPPSHEQRAAHGGVVRRQDGTTAYSPIWDWSTDRVWEYLAAHEIPANPVYVKLRAVGAPEVALRVSHLFDGARLELGRLTWLRRGWPDLFAQLERDLPRLREFL